MAATGRRRNVDREVALRPWEDAPQTYPEVIAAAFVAAAVAASCAAPRQELVTPASCEFAVYNLTPHALEIRMRVRRLSTTPIGALNPGEVLTDAVPCDRGTVWIVGIPIPSQVGARVSFSSVQGHVDLIEGQRVQVALQWP